MKVYFDETLFTGHAVIDEQHRELIDRMNRLMLLCENEKPARKEAIYLLGYLADYTEYHFAEEEKLQEAIGYPGLAEHKKKHDELRRTVDVLHAMLEEQEGPTAEFVEQVHRNVAEWLYHHIQSVDRSVAEYIFMRENENRL